MSALLPNLPVCKNRSLFDILYSSLAVQEPYGDTSGVVETVLPLSPDDGLYRELLRTLTEPLFDRGIGWEAEGEAFILNEWYLRALDAKVFKAYKSTTPDTTYKSINTMGERAAYLVREVIPQFYEKPPLVTQTTPGSRGRPPTTRRVALPLSEYADGNSGALPGEIVARVQAREAIRGYYIEAARLIACAEYVMAQVTSYAKNRQLSIDKPDPTKLSRGVPQKEKPPTVALPNINPFGLSTVPPGGAPPIPALPGFGVGVTPKPGTSSVLPGFDASDSGVEGDPPPGGFTGTLPPDDPLGELPLTDEEEQALGEALSEADTGEDTDTGTATDTDADTSTGAGVGMLVLLLAAGGAAYVMTKK